MTSARRSVILFVLCACGRTELLSSADPTTSPPRFEGFVVVRQRLEPFLRRDPPPHPSVFAAFGGPSLRRFADHAEYESFGCHLELERPLDAGTLSAGVGTFSSDAGVDTFSLLSNGTYFAELSAPTLPSAMEVSFSGAAIPAFAVTMDTVDQRAVAIEGFSCRERNCTAFPRGRDLTVSWDAGRGDAVVRIDSVARGLYCRFQGNLGHATLAASDLQQLKGDTVIELGTFTSTEVRRGPMRVNVRTFRQSLEGSLVLP